MAKLHYQSWKTFQSMMYCTTTHNSSAEHMKLLCTTAPRITNVLPVLLQKHCIPLFARKEVIYSLLFFTEFRTLSLVFEGFAFIIWKALDAVHWVENKNNKDHHHCTTSWPAKQ